MPLDLQGLLNDPDFQKLPPARQQAILDRNNVGPRMSPSPTASPAGFEDTKADAQAVLDRHPDQNTFWHTARTAAQLAGVMSGAEGLAALPGAARAGIGALRGLSTAQKAVALASPAKTLAWEGGKAIAADQAMKFMGVSPEGRAAALALAGMTSPGQAARGALKAVFTREAAPAAEAVATVAPAALDEGKAAILAASQARREAQAAEAVAAARGAQPAAAPAAASAEPDWMQKIRAAQASGTLPPGGPPSAPILPEGQRGFPTNLGGPARPGPAPTPPDQLEAALRASVNQPPSPLRPDRVRVGAQRVGRELGMSKEEVRKATGSLYGEELGAASDKLPTSAIESIANKIVTLPKGAAREAYFQAATSRKARVNVAIIREALESQGLLVPLAVAGAGAAAASRPDYGLSLADLLSRGQEQ